jgi:heptosyltransferase-3
MSRPDSFDRILVICTRLIGDVLLTTPLIHAAKQRWPQSRIDVLGFEGTLGMLEGNPDVNELIQVKAGSGWLDSLGLVRRLWRRYDLALIAQHTDRAHLYGFVAARRRSGQVANERRAWWKRALLDHAVVLGQGREPHVMLEKMRLLEPWAVSSLATVVPPPGAPLPVDVAGALQVPYVVMQVPTRVRYKQWPIEHYRSVVSALVSDGVQVVLTGSAAPSDRAATAAVASAGPATQVLDVAGRLDLKQLTALLSGAAAYVGPDTSITHLAAACDIPVVALYGPINPRLWGPWPGSAPAQTPYERRALRQQAGKVILLQGDQACVPCNGAGCERHDASRSDCLETMAPQRVLDELVRVLPRGDSRTPKP